MTTWFDAKEARAYPVIGIVDAAEQLLGFGTYGPFRSWAAYRYTVEHSLYVHRDHRGRGSGRALLRALIERARAQGYHNLVAGIDGANQASKNLHLRPGASRTSAKARPSS